MAKEVAKLENKKKQLDGQLKKLTETSQKPDYETKVPEKVRTQNAEKVRYYWWDALILKQLYSFFKV